MTDKYSPEEIEKAAEILRHFSELERAGDRRAFPLSLYKARMGCAVQPAVEAIIIDGKGRYCLQGRPADEKDFGAGQLHIIGGFAKVGERPDLVSEARWMATEELKGKAGDGAHFQDILYTAGPIAVYQWVPGEHPVGWPRSEVYVFQAVGPLPKRPDLVWFDYANLPTADKIILGRAGELHLGFLRVFQDWAKAQERGEAFSCVDLNQVAAV